MGKKILIVFLVFIIVIFLGVPLIYHRFRVSFKKSPEFRTVENAIKENKVILEQTGGTLEFEDFGGTIVGDSARIGVTLKGKNNSILARYYLIKKDTSWEIKSYEIFKKLDNSDKWIRVYE